MVAAMVYSDIWMMMMTMIMVFMVGEVNGIGVEMGDGKGVIGSKKQGEMR